MMVARLELGLIGMAHVSLVFHASIGSTRTVVSIHSTYFMLLAVAAAAGALLIETLS